MIYLPIAAALAIGLTSAAPTTANAESLSMENYMRHDGYYAGSVYVAPTYAYREYYGYPYYYRSRPAYVYDDRYHRPYHRPLFGLQLPFVGLHLG
jgi:hypothetical protein